MVKVGLWVLTRTKTNKTEIKGETHTEINVEKNGSSPDIRRSHSKGKLVENGQPPSPAGEKTEKNEKNMEKHGKA